MRHPLITSRDGSLVSLRIGFLAFLIRDTAEKIFGIFVLLVTFLLCTYPLHAQPQVLDEFEDISGWKPIVSDGAELKLERGAGRTGSALVLDFEFHGGSGYVIAQKPFQLDLPPNYKFSFYLRGEAPVNNFEFKLLDSVGNVYWIKKLNVGYPHEWTKQTVRRRHITFAWGVAGGGEIRRVAKIEFVVSVGTGGKGKVFIDDFQIEPLQESAQISAPPKARASTSEGGTGPQLVFDGKPSTIWKSSRSLEEQWFLIDLQKQSEIGGLIIDWMNGRYARAYDVELSDDSKRWTTAYSVTNSNGDRDYIDLAEAEGRFIRLKMQKSSNGKGYGIRELTIKGPDFSATPNAFFTAIAQDAPPGCYPKYFLQQQSYWTIVGADGDSKEALINEQGMVEVDKGSFSLEPFLSMSGHLITWHDVHLEQSLDSGYLPIPSVRWKMKDLTLAIRTFAAGESGKSFLGISYKITNTGRRATDGNLFLALRPFQVDPPWQALNMVGGATKIKTMARANDRVVVNDDKVVISFTPIDGFGAAEFDHGDITEYLQHHELPRGTTVSDHFGYASGAMKYGFMLKKGESKEVVIVVPFYRTASEFSARMARGDGRAWIEKRLEETRKFWQTKTGAVQIRLPKSAQGIVNTIKASIAYTFINRDGPAFQPGSRSYERSWIRDGSLISAALLCMGVSSEVREYIDWYAPYQYADGKIPCVVDSRGPDPVPENDSNGEFIYIVRQYFLFTKDMTWLRKKFDSVVRAVRYIQELRRERTTELYRKGNPVQRACYGLVPESISHEGYSAKPMHSYWDDFFVLRGLSDASEIAGVLGEKKLRDEFRKEAENFRQCLYTSMNMAMTNMHVDYIPGCVELGDFDPTSTAIGVNPIGELGKIPQIQLSNTFDKYYRSFIERRGGKRPWENYTPYEARIIGAFVYMDQKNRARDLLSFFMKDQRPQGWNHWAEVVWRDPAAPKFIGDMPHSWVSSDFLRSVRSMFVYERERDTLVVVGAGILPEWLDNAGGVAVSNLPTYFGRLNYSMKKNARVVRVELSGKLDLPPNKIILKSPLADSIKAVQVNGRNVAYHSASEVRIERLPAMVTLQY